MNMSMSHLSFVIPTGADTPMFLWLIGFIGFPVAFLSIYFWYLLREVGKEDKRRVLARATNENEQYQ